jgi:YD repeat-containing protein
MRGCLDVCSRINQACCRIVVVSFRKRVRLLAVVLVLSLLIAALPASSGRARATEMTSTAGTVAEASLPLQFYRNARTAFAALGTWIAAGVRSGPAEPASIYEPVTAYISPAPPFIDAPTNLSVTAAADTSLSLSWTAPAGSVDHYQIERSQSVAGPFVFRANSSTTTFQDTSVTTDQAYLYRVRAVTSGGVPSVPGNMALGTATSFEFNGAGLVGKTIKKQHVNDIRTAINAVRAVAGLSAATWTRSDLTNLPIVVNDLAELRARLGEALTALGISVAAYTDPILTANVTLIKGAHVEELQVRSTRGSSNSFGPIDSDTSSARLDPLNTTGGGSENPLSRNFNWNLSLVGFPGRAGMDLGLTLSYNSLVWTRVGNSVSFDDDNGFPGPGFRLGFPVLQQPAYFNSEVGKNAYLLIGVDGSRIELRQVSTSGAGAMLFEAADSSHLLLDTTATPFTLFTTDGTQMRYELKGTEYQCTKITDRNGNYITITYTAAGRIAIDEIIDTLGRHIDFVYDANGWLTQIKQLWNAGTATQYWARFEYTNTTIDTNFSDPNVGSLTVLGPADTMQIKTLSKVILPDDSHYDFSYSSWGQVWKITKLGSDNLPIHYRSYDLPQTGSTAYPDCPRFTARKDWAKYWNGDTDGTTAANEEVTTQFIVPVSDTWTMPDNTQLTGVRTQVTVPDGTVNKIYFVGLAGTTSGWSRGLPILVDTVSGGVTQRRSVSTWTQDNTAVPYMLNPRVLETNIYDAASNRARTQFVYQQFTFTNGTSCWLPRDVFEYEADGTTKLRTARTNYDTNTAYSDRRIIGLAKEKLLYQGDVNAPTPVLKSKVEFVYDEAAGFDATEVPTVQHDATGYSGNFVGRANLTKVIRHNVSIIASTSISTRYNRAGGVVSRKDASLHETLISNADSFSDNVSRGTFAYPTSVTDPDGKSSIAKYNFDFAAVTNIQTPQPSQPNNVLGPEQTFTFDSIGRLLQITNLGNNAYTRFEYSTPSQLRVDIYSTIQAGLGEVRSLRVTDGADRVIATATQHPDGVGGGYSGQRMVYDIMGRRTKTSNPTETSASGSPFQWVTTGDDEAAGWIYSQQTYDWNSRPLRTTHQNGAYKEASYSSCGCAGGEVVTFTDEGTISGGVPKRRQQKIYSDVLGRTVKTEILNWEGGTVYSTTVNTYNVRDQIEQTTEYAGAVGGTPSQVTTMAYDGYGRQISKQAPEQTAATVWTYNADDTINSITDARGASQTFAYNGRHLPTSITYAATGGISVPASVFFTYDAAGNRTQMIDGFGTMTYQYDALSQLTQETRGFPVGSFSINYSYNLAGQLMSVTDPFGASFSYTRNVRGQLKSVTGTAFAGVTNYITDVTYRAWGAPKSVAYVGFTSTIGFNSRMQPTEFRGAMRENYSYFADGTLSTVVDLDDTAGTNPPMSLRFLSRGYRYDHVGRVTQGYSISSAHIPINQTYGYDEFGNMTSRVGAYYNYTASAPASDTATFTNNRRNGWTYNADGQVTATTASSTDDPRTIAYDAAGRMTTSVETTQFNTVSYTAGYDGDGQLVKESTNTSPGTSDTSYIVRSTVLGDVLTRLDQSGNKKTTHVPAEGLLFATQRTSGAPGAFVMFTYRNPLGVSETNRAFYDPLGNYIPFQASGDPRPPAGSYNSGSMSALSANQADPNSFGVGCIMDGVPTNCNKVVQAIDRGRGKRLQILGPAITPELVRLTMSLTVVGYKIEKSTPPKPGEQPVPVELPGRNIWVFPSQVWGLYILAPGFQNLFQQNPGTGQVKTTPKKSAVDCRKEALDELAAGLKLHEEEMPGNASKLLKLVLGARAGGIAGATAGSFILPGPGSAAGALVGVAAGLAGGEFANDSREADLEAGHVRQFYQRDKECQKLAKQEREEAKRLGPSMQAAPRQQFVITRQFGTFALYPYTIVSPTLVDNIYRTYGGNPTDRVTERRGP